MIALQGTRSDPFIIKMKGRTFGELSGISPSLTGDTKTLWEGTDRRAYRMGVVHCISNNFCTYLASREQK